MQVSHANYSSVQLQRDVVKLEADICAIADVDTTCRVFRDWDNYTDAQMLEYFNRLFDLWIDIAFGKLVAEC